MVLAHRLDIAPASLPLCSCWGVQSTCSHVQGRCPPGHFQAPRFTVECYWEGPKCSCVSCQVSTRCSPSNTSPTTQTAGNSVLVACILECWPGTMLSAHDFKLPRELFLSPLHRRGNWVTELTNGGARFWSQEVQLKDNGPLCRIAL